MEKIISLAAAVLMSVVLAVPPFSGSMLPANLVDKTNKDGMEQQFELFSEKAESNNGLWNTRYNFSAVSSYGKYIRYWHNNETDYNVTVYLYRTDSGREVLVSSMKVPDNSSNSEVYYSSTADSGTYKIVIETHNSVIYGDVSAEQYTNDPSDTLLTEPSGVIDTDEGGILDLYSHPVLSANGWWDSLVSFDALPSYGNYIRYWHNNETDYEVIVFLYRTDSGKDVLVSTLTVPANSSKSEIYYSSTADSGSYKIGIETHHSVITGQVSITQCVDDPSDTLLADPVGVTDTDEGGIMLLYDLYSARANSVNGRWDPPNVFSAVSSYGKYIRYWHNNETDYEVTLYLFRTDSGRDVQVSSVKVPAHDNKSAVYYNASADSGTYKIVIETFNGRILGDVAAAQYMSRPS